MVIANLSLLKVEEDWKMKAFNFYKSKYVLTPSFDIAPPLT